MESELKKTKNYFKAVGEVYELNLTQEDKEITKKDADGNIIGKIAGECIHAADYRNPAVSIRTDKGIIGFNAYFSSHNQKPNKDGNYENQRWKMATEMLNWNPVINGNGQEPTLVTIEGSLDVNDFVTSDGNVRTALKLQMSKGSTKVSDEATGCSWAGNMFIKAIRPEVRGEDEETGRLVVDLYAVNNSGEVMPFKGIVEEDMADDFNDCFEANQTVNMTLDIVARHVGSKAPAKKAFGRSGTINTSSGFDVTELIIVGADEPIEEPDEEDDDGNLIDNGWLNPKTVAKAIKERAKKLEELKANGGKKSTPSQGNSLKNKKPVKKAAAPNPFDDEDDEDGFGSDEDDPF